MCEALGDNQSLNLEFQQLSAKSLRDVTHNGNIRNCLHFLVSVEKISRPFEYDRVIYTNMNIDARYTKLNQGPTHRDFRENLPRIYPKKVESLFW